MKRRARMNSYLLLTLAGIINAFGITFFLYPVNLYDAGISGLSMLLAQLTGEKIPMSVFLVAINIPLFILGYKKMGLEFTLKSIYSVAIYSFSCYIILYVLPVDVTSVSPLAEQDLLLCAIFGGLFSGLGSGLTIRAGGAIDGIDVLAVLFAKRLNLSVGNFSLIYNVLLYICAGFAAKSWILPLYSMITYAIASKAIDFITEGLDRGMSAMIITSRPEEVCSALSDEFRSGITILDAKGYYSGSEKTLVYFVVNRFQVSKLRKIVKETDKEAYVAITETADVFSPE